MNVIENEVLPKTQIKSLQVFRGLAALAVVAHHASVSTNAFVADVPVWAMSVFGFGYLGVDFFFVLSGFIIMYAHFKDGCSGPASRRYIFKRLVRIFPAYLPISLALIFLYAAMPGFSRATDRDYSLISSLFLLPADRPPALSVAWTLVHELIFYFVFLLFFISRRFLIYGLLVWAALIFFCQQALLPYDSWLRYPLSELNIEFMLGVLAAWFIKLRSSRLELSSNKKWLGWVFCGLVVTCLGLFLILNKSLLYPNLIFASGLALLIVGFVIREKLFKPTWPIFLMMMGNASYSIYLVHGPLMSVTQRLLGSIGLSWRGALLIGIVLSVLAGYAYYVAVERPALQFLNKYSKKK